MLSNSILKTTALFARKKWGGWIFFQFNDSMHFDGAGAKPTAKVIELNVWVVG